MQYTNKTRPSSYPTRQNDNPIINLTAPKRASQNQQLEAVQNVNEA